MEAYFDVYRSLLQNSLGPELGQLAASSSVAIIVLAVLVAFYRMIKASTNLPGMGEDRAEALSRGDSTGAVKAPRRQTLTVKLDKGALQKARELLNTGSDLDSVCRAIEPEYASWASLQQQIFRRAMETLLNTQRAAGI